MAIFPPKFSKHCEIVDWLEENIGGPAERMYYGFAGPGWKDVRYVTSSINVLHCIYITDEQQYLKALLYFGDDPLIELTNE